MAGNWQTAAYTVTYPLCKTAKSEAHIALYLSFYSITVTLKFDGIAPNLSLISFEIALI